MIETLYDYDDMVYFGSRDDKNNTLITGYGKVTGYKYSRRFFKRPEGRIDTWDDIYYFIETQEGNSYWAEQDMVGKTYKATWNEANASE